VARTYPRHIVCRSLSIRSHHQRSYETREENLQSTKTLISKDALNEDYFPPSNTPNLKTNETVYAMVDPRKMGSASMDLTGRFPYTSRRGNQYILVGYHYDANYIAVTPLKRRTGTEITNGWKKLNATFAKAGMQPRTYIMDNETSKELLEALGKKKIAYQLPAPHMHRANAAEKAIQTFKDHFLSGLTLCHSKFPLEEWDHLLEQAEITLNLLRSSRVNPTLSAYAQLKGQFDFNATPMAPPGTKVIIHDKPKHRASWALHGTDGFYIGPYTSQ